jgi:hypothetical protein
MTHDELEKEVLALNESLKRLSGQVLDLKNGITDLRSIILDVDGKLYREASR